MIAAVTGAAGFIGRHLTAELLRRGWQVRVLLHRGDLATKAHKFRGSILQPETLPPFLQGAHVLFHLATALGNRVIGEEDFFRINRDGTSLLLECAVACGVPRVVHFSSAGIYGRTSGLVPLKEEDPAHPIDPYERSKWAGEAAALAFRDHIHLNIIRPGWVYGPEDRRTFKLIRQVAQGPFFIAGRGAVKHSPITVEELVSAALLVGQRGVDGHVYNIGGPPLSVAEMVRVIAAQVGYSRRIRHVPLALVYPPAAILDRVFGLLGREAPLSRAKLAFFLRGKPLDSGKILAELGFRVEEDFSRGMARTVAWYRMQNWL